MTKVQRLSDDEAGFGLIELLIAMVIMSIVMAVAAQSAIHAMKVHGSQLEEVDTLGRTRIAMERMTREVRAANPLILAEDNRVTVQVTRGTRRVVTTYELVADRIDFTTAVTDTTTGTTTTSPARPLLRGVQMSPGQPVFTYTSITGVTGPPAPGSDLRTVARVGITLRVPLVESANAVQITDTVTVRNAAAV